MRTFGVSLTTVVTPAASQVLVDVASIKRELGIAGGRDDAFLATLAARASAAAARYCHRVFAVESVCDEAWPDRDPYPCLVPGGLGRLQLTRWPVVAVSSVTEAGAPLIEGSDFRTDAQRGQLVRLDAGGYPRPWAPLYLAVTYQGGFATIPPDVADAVTRMVRARWFARDRDPALRSESVAGVWDATYWFGSGPGSSGALPPDIAALLDPYRVPVVG